MNSGNSAIPRYLNAICGRGEGERERGMEREGKEEGRREGEKRWKTSVKTREESGHTQ